MPDRTEELALLEGGVDFHHVLAAARGLAELVRDEYPTRSLVEIVETWAPATLTPEMREGIRLLEEAGVFGA